MERMSENTGAPSEQLQDDEEAQRSAHEAPNVPEGGIPNLEDDGDQRPSDPSASEIAEQEQKRQQQTGEENPTC
jgi:hypothetical protein